MSKSDETRRIPTAFLSVSVGTLLGLIVVLALWLTEPADESPALFHSPLAPYLWLAMIGIGVGAGLFPTFRQSIQCTTLFYVPLVVGLVVEIVTATETDGLWVVALFLVGLMGTVSAGISVVVRRVRGIFNR